MRSVDVHALLVLAVGVERLVELVVSRRNERRLARRGAVEHGAEHYPVMVALHAALLLGCLVEPRAFDRPFDPAIGAPATALVVLAQALRWWSIASLGGRWTTRVFVLPRAARVARGPYRFFSHPNYVAVVVEGAALPLVHGAWATAIAFTALDALLLRRRVAVEDAALDGAIEARG